jgi:hypothetical protein
MSLILKIEYLSGIAFAAIGPDREAPDWPPQPIEYSPPLSPHSCRPTMRRRGEQAILACCLCIGDVNIAAFLQHDPSIPR